MLKKRLDLEIDFKSWKPKKPPSWASTAITPDMRRIDIAKALLMLGTLTTPSGLSAGSPERYWACLRYFSACLDSTDLRIRSSFLGLDPHQKGILSDDFGVAVSTTWLADRLGGVREIVDGRQFMINMGVHFEGARIPKVGHRKCPDYVLEDRSGRLHVLECKGTQSSRWYLDRAMATGRVQKHGIRINDPRKRGECLVIGVCLAGEGQDRHSQLVVVDPEDEPLTTIEPSDEGRTEDVLTRLSLSRALNLTGFPSLAFEMAWPDHLKKESGESQLLTESERKQLSQSPNERQKRLDAELQKEFAYPGRRKAGRPFHIQEMRFDIPALVLDSGDVVRRITVRRGIQEEVLQRLAESRAEVRAVGSSIAQERARQKAPIRFDRAGASMRMDYKDLFFSEIAFD